jgi:hypothetical protein
MLGDIVMMGGAAAPFGWNCSEPLGTLAATGPNAARLRCEVVPRTAAREAGVASTAARRRWVT